MEERVFYHPDIVFPLAWVTLCQPCGCVLMDLGAESIVVMKLCNACYENETRGHLEDVSTIEKLKIIQFKSL
jgi:hypothetical protein